MSFLLPYLPEPPATQSLLWWSDVLKSRNGKEHRTSMDGGAAAEHWSLNVTFGDTPNLLLLREYLFKDPVSPVLVPAGWEELTVLATTNTTITVDGTYADWPVNGAQVLLVKTDGVTALQETVSAVSGFGTSTCVLTVGADPTGYKGAAVLPLRTCQVPEGQQISYQLVNGGSVQLAVTTTDYAANLGTGASLTTFDSLPVVDRRLIGTQHDERFQAESETIDYGGAYEVRWSKTRADVNRSVALFVANAADRQWVKQLGVTLRGRQGLFLLPTWQDDILIHTQPSPGATTLLTDSPDYVTYYFASLAHRRLFLRHADGSIEYAKVTNAVDNGNGTATLTLASGLSGTAIAHASLLEQCRLNTDEIRFTWTSGWNGRAEFEALVVQQ